MKSVFTLIVAIAACHASVIPHAGYSYIPSGITSYVQAAPTVVAAAPAVIAPAPVLSYIASPGLAIAPAVVKAEEDAKAEVKSAEPAPVSEPEAPAEPAPAEPAPASDDSVAVDAAPAPAPINPYVPVEDTPEVVAARQQHLAAFQETQARDAALGVTEEPEPSSEEPSEAPTPAEPASSPAQESAPASAPESAPASAPESSPAPAPESSPAPAPEAKAAEPAPLLPSAVSTVQIAGPLPAVPIAPIAPVAAIAAPAVARVAAVAAPSVSPVATPLAPIAPAVAAIAPVAPVISASQYRYQDELGQFAFGHVGGPNSRSEVKTADGITTGGFAYVDGNGLIQSASYVSDPVNGFRVAATNLPVQPAPTYLTDTPEVAEAKAALLKAQQEHLAKL